MTDHDNLGCVDIPQSKQIIISLLSFYMVLGMENYQFLPDNQMGWEFTFGRNNYFYVELPKMIVGMPYSFKWPFGYT